MLKNKLEFCACNTFVNNQIYRNKMYNKAKTDNKKIDFMPFI